MGEIKQLEIDLRPSALFGRLHAHDGDLGETSKARPIAERWFLGRKVKFYETGEHTVDGELTEEEQFHSGLLRYAHASLITGAPVGDKAIVWVDASKDPIDMWLQGMPYREFMLATFTAMSVGHFSTDIILDGDTAGTIQKTKEVIRE